MKSVLKLSKPIVNDMIQNRTEMEQLWECTFEKLNVDASEYNVLITEPPHAPEERRRWKAEVMFENFGV